MPPRFCCCSDCLLAEDNFNRADGPVGGNWYGSGTIVSGVLHADEDRTTVCHPGSAPLGSLWGHATMIDCDPAVTYEVKVGDPTGDYTVTVTFAGTVTSGTMTITVDNGSDSATHDYPWEHDDEELTVCYSPGVQLSAGPSSRAAGEHPDWVTVCIPIDPHDTCWDISGHAVGNWEFVSGYWDDWTMEIFESEKEICHGCDCYCLEDDVKSCVPDMLYVTIDGDCISDTFEMPRRYLVGTDTALPPTVVSWPQNFEWISDPILCPEADVSKQGFVIIIRCQKDSETSYPKWRAQMNRWGSALSCSLLGFDRLDPDTIAPTVDYNSFAYAKSTSTCDPVYLEFPDLVEDSFACPGPKPGSCCGGTIESGVGESPPSRMTVVITE